MDVQDDDIVGWQQPPELSHATERRRGCESIDPTIDRGEQARRNGVLPLVGQHDRMLARGIESHPALRETRVAADRMGHGQHVQHPSTRPSKAPRRLVH